MTAGQDLAVLQFREVAKYGARDIEILAIRPGAATGSAVAVDLSINTQGLERVADGLPLRDRERFVISVPAAFPFEPPSVWLRHSRFAGFPHVQWGRHLCLYQAPGSEWDPSDGVFGLLVRLEEWLAQGAVGQLDPIGAPLHPPAVYPEHDQVVIPRADTPPVSDKHWYGLAHLKVVSNRRLDVVGWSVPFGSEVNAPVGAALLLSTPMPWEFPRTVAEIVRLLEARGVSRSRLLFTMQCAVIQNPDNAPLYVLIGTPMRGIRGSGELKQHLSAWHIEPLLAQALRLALEKYSGHERLQAIGAEIEAIIWDWAEGAPLSWCAVREDRPEICIRRDHGSPMASLRGKTVAVWGCGAIGSHVAEHLVRAGVTKLILCDDGRVAPGLLVRQQFDDQDVWDYKSTALARRLRRIRDDVVVEPMTVDILDGPLTGEVWDKGVDLIVESTGSRALLKKLESRWSDVADRSATVASLAVGPHAERGMVVVAHPSHAGGPLDVARATKLEVCEREDLAHFRRDFWPEIGWSARRLFQPEPGCSDPTFVGSAADLAQLAGVMINLVARAFASRETSGVGHLLVRYDVDTAPSDCRHACFGFPVERSLRDEVRGYAVRFSNVAWQTILGTIEKSRRRRGSRVETGGILLGERDDAARVVWISEVTGPPPDSRASRSGFVCGTEGNAELDRTRGKITLGSVRFVGMWHTHPHDDPAPSEVDLQGMAQLVTSFDPPIAQALLVIIGHAPDRPTPAAYLLARSDVSVSPAPPVHLTRRWLYWLRSMTARVAAAFGTDDSRLR